MEENKDFLQDNSQELQEEFNNQVFYEQEQSGAEVDESLKDNFSDSFFQNEQTNNPFNLPTNPTFIPAQEEQNSPRNKGAKINILAIVLSCWALICSFILGVGSVLCICAWSVFIPVIKGKKTVSYKWALAMLIVATIANGTFWLVLCA
jgi:hypothetical protein